VGRTFDFKTDVIPALMLLVLGFGIGWFAHVPRPQHNFVHSQGAVMIDSSTGKLCMSVPAGYGSAVYPSCEDLAKQ
jgi:hypothetical protein